jgi:hypothetical protein
MDVAKGWLLTRILATAFCCASALLAFAGAPSGAMATLEFEADSYPPTVQANSAKGVIWLETEAGPVSCAISFDGTLFSRESTLTLTTAFSSCSAFGFSAATVKSEGCSWVLHPTEVVARNEYTAHVDLKCSTPIKVTAGSCELELKEQTGLTTIFLENDLSASPDELEFSPMVSGVKYTVSKDGFLCPFAGTGNRSNGQLASSEPVTMTGTKSGSGIRVVGTEAFVQTLNFEAGFYLVTLGSKPGGKGLFKIEMEAGAAECGANAFLGKLEEAMSKITLARLAGECVAFGSEALIANEECRYELQAVWEVAEDDYDADLNLVCPMGKSIKITAGACEVEIPSQWGLGAVEIVNDTAASPHPDITVTPEVTGMSYVVTQDGLGCPFSGTGAKADGAISSTEALTVTATETSLSLSG